jgi:hypothetical protein
MRLECWFRRRVETIFFLLAVGRVLSKREGRVCDRQDVDVGATIFCTGACQHV